MPHRPRYRLPVSERGAGGIFCWMFALLVLGIIGFVWSASRTSELKARAQNHPASEAVAKLPAESAQPTSVLPVIHSVTNRSVAPVVVTATNPPVKLTPKPESIASPTNGFPRAPRNAMELQIALSRLVISSGSIDGVNGAQTRAAVLAFQREKGRLPTGELDAATRSALTLVEPPLTNYLVTSNDLARLQPLSTTWLGKSQQTALDYENLLELVAEKGHASPTLTRKLNPGLDWTNVVVGTQVKIPAVEYPAPKVKAAFIVISLAERRLQAFDADTNLLAHFPCSIAAKFEKRPVGELHIKAIAPNPDYTFNPEVFPESEEARQLTTKLILPPGPNNPVGTAWISLDLSGYGIHGTPGPEQVGRTESHGCFRLANWNAEYLIKLVFVGMPVWVGP